MNYIRLILLFLVISTTGAVAQKKIQGTVICGEENVPLVGVSITLKGATTGTFTDVDGKYTIEAKSSDVLQYYYMSYESAEREVGDKTTIDVVLQPEATMLKEVVFMGYSSQSKAEMSSSVLSLDGDKLRDVTSNDVGSMLQGKMAGVSVFNSSGTPGSKGEIRIRGAGSISADREPLYVVDGIIGGSFEPNDVETLTVLKDAAATALYGSQASAGVIVVTTKQAKRNQPLAINFKATYGTTKANEGNFKAMNGSQLYDTFEKMFGTGFNKTKYPETLRDRNFDWVDAAFDSGSVQDYHVSVANASDKMQYMLSTNYFKEDGTLINTNFDKISTRLNLGSKLSNTVDMNVRIRYSQSSGREVSNYLTSQGPFDNMAWDNPYDKDGKPVFINSDVRSDNGEAWYGQEKVNFLHSEQYNFARNKSHDFGTDFQLNWNIFDWLSASSNNSFSRGGYTYTNFIDPRTENATYRDGSLTKNVSNSTSWGTSNLLKANKAFNAHTFNALLGWETGASKSELVTAQGTGMLPGFTSLNGTKHQSHGSQTIEYKSWSVLGQIQYNLLNRYFATASMRADANSVFGKDNRVGYFPAASAAWIVTNESFMPKIDALSFLKLRASYGVTGNPAVPPYETLATYAPGGGYQDTNGATVSRLANPQLKWEKAHMTGLGLDVTLWNRVEINLDVYNIDNKDLLLKVPRSPSTGFFERIENAAEVRNRGLEIQVSSDNMVTKDFYWNTTFNMAFNKNKVTDVPGGKGIPQSKGGAIQMIENGKDIFSWYMPKWLGVDYQTGMPVWEQVVRDGNGDELYRQATSTLADAEYQTVGKASPKFTGGFTNSLKYKGIGLDVTANFVYGNKIYNRSREKYDSDGAYVGYNMQKLLSRWSRWEKPGDIATHPQLHAAGNNEAHKYSSRYLEDGSFLRIKNITLSYDLPKEWLTSIKIKQCKVFVSADNIFTATKFSGMDPELSMKRTDWSLPGLYGYAYPINKQILFGIDVKF